MIIPVSVKNQSIDSSGITSDYKAAISEYVWNGFEANATKVSIEYTHNEAFGVKELIIKDNGEGMGDMLTPEQRRKNMQHICSKNTKIEVILRKALWKRGYRYRKNYKELPGKPDIVLTKYKIAIFCDSEFFHGKDWEVLKPRLEKGSNSNFWISKISRNRERDDEVNKKLLFMGWTVVRFWGNDIKKNTDECIRVIEETIFEIKMQSEDFD